jgi:(p)ppGpp synthase/HD superfamily hydrolase
VNGEEAIEFLDKDKGYCVHRANCNKIITYYERDYQINDFHWKCSNNRLYHSKLILLITNKVGSLREVVNCIFDLRINIINITTTNTFEDFFECSVIIEVKDIEQLENLMAQFNSLKLLHSSARYMQN